MTQNKSALSHPAAPDSLSALRAAPRSESRAVEGSELPASLTHTPGPWVLTDTGGQDIATIEPQPETMEVTNYWTVATVNRLRPEWRENAALVKATPDLLAALRNLVVMLPSDHEECDDKARVPAGFVYIRWQDLREARAAIDRATS